MSKVQTFGDALKDTLIVRVLQQHVPRIAEAFALLGIITAEYVADTTQIHRFSIDWHKLNLLLSNPGAVAGDTNWWLTKIGNLDGLKQMQVILMLLAFSPEGLLDLEYKREGFFALPVPPNPIDLNDLVDKLINSPLRIQFPVPDTAYLTTADLLAAQTALGDRNIGNYFELSAPDDDPPAAPFPDGVALALHLPQIEQVASRVINLGGWQLSFASPNTGAGTIKLAYHNGGWDHADGSTADFTILLRKLPNGGSPALVIGGDEASLEIGEIDLNLHLHPAGGTTPLFSVSIALEPASLVLSIGALKILSSALPIPDNVRFDADFLVTYLQGAGFQAQGTLEDGTAPALGLHIAQQLDVRLGSASVNLTIDTVTAWVEKKLDSLDWRVMMRSSASASFGPFHATMDGFGAWFGHYNNQSMGLLPPTGIGIEIDAGFMQGGGFLAVDTHAGHQRYSGALNLKLLFFSVFAFGILEETDDGMSFVAVIGVRFPGGIQLGFGFMVTGVGGVIGINRRANTDLLRDRLASGASGNVLFCDDPVKNAPVLLGDLAAFFPAEHDVFIIGPTFQLSWMYIVRLDLGVFIELPGPRKIFIAGSARVLIGFDESAALIFLRMDFIGGIDFTTKLIFFDAALVNSNVLGIISITGGMVFRLAYGDPSYFVLSVGGFNPNFHPEPMNVPQIARVGASLSVDVVVDIWLRLEMYVAFTTNTFQIGASVEAGMDLGPISAHGWFKFDALIQFNPFFFTASIDAGFDLEAFGVSVANVNISGTMSGPGPIVIHAEASFKRLFIKVSGSATFTLGDNNGDQENILATAFDELLKQLGTLQNLRTEGDDHTVLLRPDRVVDANIVLISPLGSFTWEEKIAPLATDLERFRGFKLKQVEKYGVSSALVANPPVETDQFGLGTFTDLDQSEALSTSVFETLPSGIHLASGYTPLDNGKTPDLSIDLKRIPDTHIYLSLKAALYLPAGVLDMTHERYVVSAIRSSDPKVSLTPETHTAYSANGSAIGGAQATSQANAFQAARRAGGFVTPADDELIALDGV